MKTYNLNFKINYNISDELLSSKKYYLDLEFKKNHQIGSIGCIFTDNRKIIDEFHMVIDDKFITKGLQKSISDGVKTVNKLRTLCKRFNEFLLKYGEHPILSWGDDGTRLNKFSSNKYTLFKNTYDISKLVANSIYYNNKKIGTPIALKDIKKIYSIGTGVKHEALSDAIDLFNVFEKFINKEPMIMLNEIIGNKYLKNVI